MADKKISDFTALTVIAADDLIEVETSAGNSRKVKSQHAGIASGTSFPGSPSSGDRFWRSDRGIEYYYDGTRWLSTQLFTLPIANQDTNLPAIASGQVYAGNPWWNDYALYVLKGKISITNTATTASNYFTFQFSKFDGTLTNIGGTTNSQGDTQNQMAGHEISINEVIASTVDGFQLTYTETGTATGYILGSLQYRLIG